MKYVTIETKSKHCALGDFENLHAAERAIGLDPFKTDHGVIRRAGAVTGIGFVVFEFAFYVPASEQHYCGIGSRLIAGDAVLYGFRKDGKSVDLTDDDLQAVAVRWFNDVDEIETEIAAGTLVRPEITINKELIWRWPQATPKPFK
jgi:hypothetical protein